MANLERNDTMKVRWMCNVSLNDSKSSDELRACETASKGGRQRWFGHFERMNKQTVG